MRISSDGLPFILPLALASTVVASIGWPLPAALLVVLTVAVAAFFRDPDRASDAPAGAVLSPADGRVLDAGLIADGRVRVVIFLSLFDVHVARSPVPGELVECVRRPGGYAAAFRDEASRNARVEMRIRTPQGILYVGLMAGLVARRVLPWVSAPATLRRGQRVAIIRFGSRSEIETPRGYVPAVRAGDTVRAGQTVIALLSKPRQDERHE